MYPFINRNLVTFFDLYEFWDNDPDNPDAIGERPGFKQMWEESPFCQNYMEINEGDLESVYNRLLSRFYVAPFGMLDERQIHLNVFRIIRDYMPNVTKRINTLNELYQQDIAAIQARTVRTNVSQSSGANNLSDTGFENQAAPPNTAASPTEPIIDNIMGQRNRNLQQAGTDNRNSQMTDMLSGDLGAAYTVKLNAIVDGLWDDFLKRFDKLFVQMYAGMFDYMYRNEKETNVEPPVTPYPENSLDVFEGPLTVTEGNLVVTNGPLVPVPVI